MVIIMLLKTSTLQKNNANTVVIIMVINPMLHVIYGRGFQLASMYVSKL